MTTLDASSVECHLFTFKDGALSALAHDLELKVTRSSIELGEPSPAGEATELTISARFFTDSIVVLHALKDGKPTSQLSDSDRRKIERTIVSDVLDVRRFPDARFTGSATLPSSPSDATASIPITGELLLQGRRRTLTTQARRDGDHLHIELTLHQPDFGIAPYSALLGTLKLRPDLKVRLTLRWPLPT